MAKKNRDDFSEKTKLQIARRANGLCSYPFCGRPTMGATADDEGYINIGTAAHITAAAPGGPRYDATMTPEKRRSVSNGIWMCRDHGKAIDSNDPEFTVERLREWKAEAEAESRRNVLRNPPPGRLVVDSNLAARIFAAAASDVSIFRRTPKWPSSSVALSLKVFGSNESATTSALANLVTSLDDLILVAPPGMGKTTTVFQIAEGILTNHSGVPLVVLLGEWATQNETLLGAILSRPAFRDISDEDLRKAAERPGFVLLLDGWNELDSAARTRARVQIEALKAQLPELGFVISTRKQVLDVPFEGTRLDLLPLSETQQMEIATSTRGEVGARILDQAWRTAGVRELIAVPLYLIALLSLPEGAPFPTTKEQVLRRFVAAHERAPLSSERLGEIAQGFQQDFLDGLADVATRSANTALTDSNARKSISDTTNKLLADGQIVTVRQPNDVLEVLVSHHVLMRAGDTPGYLFQHQQFQEWYASHYVERLMMDAAQRVESRNRLKAEVFDKRQWEEAVLFAVERLARGREREQQACGAAILVAFEVDAMLAAEMIFRSTDPVWGSINEKMQRLVRGWHRIGAVDRALRFMITSGRPEFLDLVWPLITHEDDQVHFSALRAGNRFRPSVLGTDPARRIEGLPLAVRKNFLHEIAARSGMDGLDLATAIAKEDKDSEVKAAVIHALVFRRADRHVAEVLSTAEDKLFDALASERIIDDVSDTDVQKRLKAARERKLKADVPDHERLVSIMISDVDPAHDAEVTAIISQMEIDEKRDDRYLLNQVYRRYPRALADGLLSRVRENRSLTYGADDILASVGIALEDEKLADIALAETSAHDRRAEAAASVLGPLAACRMVDALFEAKKRERLINGEHDQAASDRSYNLRVRIGHIPGSSLIAAVKARSADAKIEEIAELAELLCRQSKDVDERGRPFNPQALATITELAQLWGERMLASGIAASRSQVASIATLISYAPATTLLPLLKRLLDDNLRRYRAFREEAEASGWQARDAVHESRMPLTHEYMHAFLSIKAPETAVLMEGYLADEHFGVLAATVLAAQWTDANEPRGDKKFGSGVDFSRVKERRAARAAHPAETSAEGEAIFRAIDLLISNGATDRQKKLAVELGIIGARLPHGQREATIQKLISLAPRRSRAGLLLNLVLSGEEIGIKLVAAGIAEVLEAAKVEPWILSDNAGYQLREWLRLLPFVDRPTEALPIVRGLPKDQRSPQLVEEMVGAFVEAPSAEGEQVLFELAEEDERLYAMPSWRRAVLRMNTLSAARRFIQLTAAGVFNGSSTDSWHLDRQIGSLIREHPELRSYVLDLLKDGLISPGLELLAQSFAASPDPEGLLLLIRFEMEQKRPRVGWHMVEEVITERVPSESWKGAYDVVPVAAVELRKKLLSMTTTGGVDDTAARCLTLIDQIRDDIGAPENELRHPDLASGRPWPIISEKS